jgi:hypothetical protein
VRLVNAAHGEGVCSLAQFGTGRDHVGHLVRLIRERPGIAFNGARAAHVGELTLFILPEHKRTYFREVLLQPIFGVSSEAALYFRAAAKMLARGSGRWGFQ